MFLCWSAPTACGLNTASSSASYSLKSHSTSSCSAPLLGDSRESRSQRLGRVSTVGESSSEGIRDAFFPLLGDLSQFHVSCSTPLPEEFGESSWMLGESYIGLCGGSSKLGVPCCSNIDPATLLSKAIGQGSRA